MSPDVSILIVSYNTRALTLACLESLADRLDGVRAEVVVVDNGSLDGTAEAVRARFPSVRVLAEQVNHGFARAVNIAAAHASGDALLLLNPDTVVLADTVAAMLAFLRSRPGAGIVGGRTVRPDGSVEPSSCWGAPTLWSMTCFGLGLSALRRRSRLFDPESLGRWQRDTVREVGVVTGCLLMVERATFARLGGFDERYFMYGEDVDLSLRARREGFRPAITPEAVVVHHVGASSRPADKMVLVFAGKTTLVRSHWSGAGRSLALTMLGLGVAWRGLSAAALRRLRPAARVPAWEELWQRRRTWWQGYEGAAVAPCEPVATP